MSTDKQLWILAGGNGAGKSTFYRLFLEPRALQFVNADLIAQKLNPEQPEKASYDAANLAEKIRYQLLEEGVSFCFETVFSHPSKIDFIAAAKALGYEIILVYIHLESDQLNKARVAQRVSEGGHNVPAEKVVSRIPRTLKHISTVLPLVDLAQFYDNSALSTPFLPVARLKNGELEIMKEQLPGWAKALLAEYTSGR